MFLLAIKITWCSKFCRVLGDMLHVKAAAHRRGEGEKLSETDDEPRHGNLRLELREVSFLDQLDYRFLEPRKAIISVDY